MSKLVVDSCVAIKWFMLEQHSAEARRILDGYQAGVLDLLVPDLIYAEIGNIVWKKSCYQGLAAADARAVIAAFQSVSFTVVSTAILLDEGYHLAIAHQRPVYDMLYLALSIRESCQLVTADEKLVNAVSTTFSNVIQLASWP